MEKRSTKETICDQCGKNFKKDTFDFKRTKHNFCSRNCNGLFQKCKIQVKCSNCGKIVRRTKSQLKKTKNSFCNKSCAAKHNNKFKRQSRRSKIEIKFYNLLVKELPNLNILPNDKTMLDGLEVDIAIPSLKLAIEWNGIVHFKPIYGQTKLNKIQQIDAEKLKIASNKNINLIVIPDFVSNDKILQQAFNDVKKIINNLI